VKKRKLSWTRLVPGLTGVAKFLLKSQLLTVWLALCGLGVFVGIQARPERGAIPYEEMFENMGVLSYRETPSDSTARFVVELSARGRPFRQYDIDARQFLPPVRGHDYRRSISGTRYPALQVRGHVDRGVWLELSDRTGPALLPDQFEELYRTTLDYVKPVSIVTNALAMLSGYSIGYRLATWSSSLSNPAVQERLVATPGIGRAIAREAWRRVLLEPVVMAQESDAGRFASVRGTQRIYTNFFKLAVNDSNGFIPHEAARLDSAGGVPESRAMLAFARAVQCAVQDTCDLTSADFSAVEDWASLLDRHGHWAYRTAPPLAGGRLQYFGTLAWYGLAPDAADERRIWIGPRLLVRNGDLEGFVADEIPSIDAGCPVAWRDWLRGDAAHPSGNAWTAQWMAESRQLAPLVSFCLGVARAARGGGDASRLAAPSPQSTPPAAARPPIAARISPGSSGAVPGASSSSPAPEAPAPELPSVDLRRVFLPDSALKDSARADRPVAQRPDSLSVPAAGRRDSIQVDPDGMLPDLKVIRANLGGLGR